MSLTRGKFGIEYNPRQADKRPSVLGWVFAIVALAALVSLAWTLVKRLRTRDEYAEPPRQVAPADVPARPAEAPAAPAEPVESTVPEPVIAPEDYGKRPPRVRNLLMRLEEAERQHDVEMIVTTIESIRALPGMPAADVDDDLARRLGSLNLQRLFLLRNAQWVKTVTVRRGDSASRIAAENGSTFASFVRLNGGKMDKLPVGAKVYVMDHPRFGLVIRCRTKTADLSLNGKFFKRYDLQGEVTAETGAYELSEKRRAFWKGIGAPFRPADRVEIDTLMPVGSSVLISEM